MSSSLDDPRLHRGLVPVLLALAAAFAVTSLLTDSVTFDETSHLATGLSYLRTHDFRLAPDHPPLAKIWCAWPLLLVEHEWPPPDNRYWLDGNTFRFARVLLFDLNDGQHLVIIGRFPMVVLLLATCLSVYALGRTLFGPTAGLLALGLAALSPTLLAHGRLITTDLPITLAGTLTLLTFARLMQRATWLRLLWACLALAAACVTKLSWPLLLPALAVMAVLAVVRQRPVNTDVRIRGRRAARRGARRGQRAVLVLGILVVLASAAWAGIWTCYGWRRTIVAPPPATADADAIARIEHADQKLALAWQVALRERDGTPRTGLMPTVLRAAATAGMLPDAYLLGLAQTLAATSARHAYLCGAHSTSGWWWYFPLAFAIKTPIPILALLVAGIVALTMRRATSRDPVLLVGLIVFVVVYALCIALGSYNIGQRHLLPIYPVVFVVAGAAGVWLTTRAGRAVIGVTLLWLLGANLWIHPHYLAYFNELVGGPRNGHEYLADSNIDWGQDMLRLADYADAHPDEQIKLAYFGSAIPARYLDCTSLPSFIDFTPRAKLDAGTYVVSVNQLVGLNDPQLRSAFWGAQARATYGDFAFVVASPPPENETPEQRERRLQVVQEYDELRYKRLISRLRDRPPDERVGYSLFVYRLTDEDVRELIRP